MVAPVFHIVKKVYLFVIDSTGMLLSCSAKKVTKECGIGEALRKVNIMV